MFSAMKRQNVFFGMDRGVTFGSYGDGTAAEDEVKKPEAAMAPDATAAVKTEEPKAPGPDMPVEANKE